MASEDEKVEFLIEKLIDLRREENTRFWTVFGILSIANGVLINAVAQSTDPSFVKWISIVGAVLGILWFGIQARLSYYCIHWEDKVKVLQLNEDDKYKLLTKGSPPWYSVSTKQGGYVNLLFLTFWFALLIKVFVFPVTC